MKSKQTLRTLPVLYTKEEMLNLSKDSMDCMLEIDRINNLKKNLTPLQEKAIEVSKKMKLGYEERQVSCRIEYNRPHNGKKTIIREDTGETVSIENMTGEELQEELDLSGTEIVEETKRLASGYEIEPYKEDTKGQ